MDCFYVVHSLEKEDFLENLHVLSCFVQLKTILFNLLCVVDLFSEHWQSTLFENFFFIIKKSHYKESSSRGIIEGLPVSCAR